MEAFRSMATRVCQAPSLPPPVCRHHQRKQRATLCRAWQQQQQHGQQRQRVPVRRRGGSAAAAAADALTATSSSGEGGAETAAALAGVRYTSPDGAWVVRPLDKADAAEVRRVVALQTDAFHTAAPLPLFDGMAKSFFKAEVLSEMQKKLKFNPEDMFLSLVIEPAEGAAAEPAFPTTTTSSSSSSSLSSGGGACNVVGVIEISYIAAKETLKLLEPGTDAFCYIASMVVAPAWQRRGGAGALLAAAEAAAAAWEERQALLHVHQDNLPAIQLYERSGYEVIHQINNTFAGLGPKPRYLMRKRW